MTLQKPGCRSEAVQKLEETMQCKEAVCSFWLKEKANSLSTLDKLNIEPDLGNCFCFCVGSISSFHGHCLFFSILSQFSPCQLKNWHKCFIPLKTQGLGQNFLNNDFLRGDPSYTLGG